MNGGMVIIGRVSDVGAIRDRRSGQFQDVTVEMGASALRTSGAPDGFQVGDQVAILVKREPMEFEGRISWSFRRVRTLDLGAVEKAVGSPS